MSWTLRGLGVLLGAMSDHRVSGSPPLVLRYVQGEWFTFPVMPHDG